MYDLEIILRYHTFGSFVRFDPSAMDHFRAMSCGQLYGHDVSFFSSLFQIFISVFPVKDRVKWGGYGQLCQCRARFQNKTLDTAVWQPVQRLFGLAVCRWHRPSHRCVRGLHKMPQLLAGYSPRLMPEVSELWRYELCFEKTHNYRFQSYASELCVAEISSVHVCFCHSVYVFFCWNVNFFFFLVAIRHLLVNWNQDRLASSPSEPKWLRPMYTTVLLEMIVCADVSFYFVVVAGSWIRPTGDTTFKKQHYYTSPL